MTTIEWTDVSYNPIRARDPITGNTGWHCEHVSEGCRNCYAEWRNMHPMYGKSFAGTKMEYKPVHLQTGSVEVYLDEKVLKQVLGMRKPQRVFWCSMTDLYGHWVTDAMLDQIKAVQAMTPHLTHIELTKRPERMQAYLSDLCAHGGPMHPGQPESMLDRWEAAREPLYKHYAEKGKTGMMEKVGMMPDFGPKWPLKNVWAGVSVSNQDDADKWVPILLATPAAIRFVSYEPALGAVDFWTWLPNQDAEQDTSAHAIWRGEFPGLDLIICGGESGAGARPMHPDWARKVRDDCVAAGTAFFFKQWGAWGPESTAKAKKTYRVTYWDEDGNPYSEEAGAAGVHAWNVGKKEAGRVLDRRTWDEMPGVEKDLNAE